MRCFQYSRESHRAQNLQKDDTWSMIVFGWGAEGSRRAGLRISGLASDWGNSAGVAAFGHDQEGPPPLQNHPANQALQEKCETLVQRACF